MKSNQARAATLPSRQLPAKPETPALLRTTTAPSIFEAGVKDNVIPGRRVRS